MTTARRRTSAKPAEAPPLLRAIERIAENKPRPVRLAPVPEPAPAIGARDLDAHDEVILTLCGRRIERHAGAFNRTAIDPQTGEVSQTTQRTCEHTYTLWEPIAAGARYARDDGRWGAAHTLRWQGKSAPEHVEAVEWELLQWCRAITVIRGVCPELAALDGVGGMVLETRGEVLLSGAPRIRYEHARSARSA